MHFTAAQNGTPCKPTPPHCTGQLQPPQHTGWDNGDRPGGSWGLRVLTSTVTGNSLSRDTVMSQQETWSGSSGRSRVDNRGSSGGWASVSSLKYWTCHLFFQSAVTTPGMMFCIYYKLLRSLISNISVIKFPLFKLVLFLKPIECEKIHIKEKCWSVFMK